eukprot:TRINITY_DN8750_c0_g1_i1.p1 TRINITY_DN8750_c0_g1~~TRINITY_DN8750_c0_g1_i1.p1  ORF type:complete len:108 (+),score=8.87 TRINITY_DN8750_c0_g1_i1:118-441(+)
MPKRITKNTYGLSEEEVCRLGNSELKARILSKGLNEAQVRELKNYRRILRIRLYGKKFRTKERSDVKVLKIKKDYLLHEKKMLEREVTNYRQYFIAHPFNQYIWAEN